MQEVQPFSPPDPGEILRRRAQILAALLAADEGFCTVPVRSIRRATLQTMLSLYDGLFFGGFLARFYGQLPVTLSPRLTSAAGKFIYTRGSAPVKAEIRMSGDFLFRLTDGPFLLNGLNVATAQEAFLVVFEHELCHAAEFALYGSTGHSRRFLDLANGLFGHTDTRHSLPTRRSEAAQNGLLVGSRVSFPYEGLTLTGVVSYIGKTATVMVPDARGGYRDGRGRRYAKYRVPVGLLEKESSADHEPLHAH